MPNKPTPPAGYSLADVPDFLKPTARAMRIEVESPNGIDIAKVTSTQPNVIEVNQADHFSQPELNHEVEHGYQFSRNPAIVQSMEYDLATGKLPKTYDYGGIAGLLAAQQKGKTIADFGPEQRAEMVKDFQATTQKAIATGNTQLLDLAEKAYGRFLAQEARLPGKNDSMTTMTQRDLTPEAPGLPPSSITGIMEPDKRLGGVARVLKKVPMLPHGYRLQ